LEGRVHRRGDALTGREGRALGWGSENRRVLKKFNKKRVLMEEVAALSPESLARREIKVGSLQRSLA